MVKISLVSSNFTTWAKQIRNALRANDLFGYVDGSTTPLDPYTIVEQSKNLARHSHNLDYFLWCKVDRQLTSSIISIISPSTLPTIDEFEHVFELWQHLIHRFSSLITSHIHELKSKLISIVKNCSIADYSRHIKELGEKPTAPGRGGKSRIRCGSYGSASDPTNQPIQKSRIGVPDLYQTCQSDFGRLYANPPL